MALFKKAGGGFLNGVSGVITDYTFETMDGTSKKTGEPYVMLSVKLMVQQDGADAPQETYLGAGFLYGDATVSEDGKSLLDAENPDELLIRDNTELAGFIGSMIEKGFPEEKFDPSGRNFEAMLGGRYTFGKVIDEERNKRQGKRKDKKDTKKEYNHELLRVTAVLALPEEKKGKKTAAKAAPAAGAKKGAAATKTKAAPVAAAATEASDDDQPVVDALITILADAKGNTVPRAQLSSLVVRYSLSKGIEGEDRENLRKRLISDEFIALEQGWAFDAAAKTITLA